MKRMMHHLNTAWLRVVCVCCQTGPLFGVVARDPFDIAFCTPHTLIIPLYLSNAQLAVSMDSRLASAIPALFGHVSINTPRNLRSRHNI
jgi:hypothetical protein